MPTFLSDPAPAFYLVLLAFVVITAAVAGRNQDRRSIIRFAIALAALLVVYGIDKAVESPREEAVRRIQAMADAADAKNPDRFVEHLADSVEFRNSAKPVVLKKEAVHNLPFWSVLRQYNVTVRVWDFSRDDFRRIDDNNLEVGFSAKGETEGKMIPIYMKGEFKKQPDGKWKLTAFASYDFARHD